MSPIIDQLLVGAIVLGALLFLVLRILSKRSRKGQCGGGCCMSAGKSHLP